MSQSSHENEPGVEQTTWKQPAGKVPTDATKANMVQTEKVEGETVLLEQSSAEHIEADRVTVTMSKVSKIEASSVQMEKSASVQVNTSKAALQECATVQLNAHDVRMVKSSSLLMINQSTTMEAGSTALLVITGGLKGEARALVTVPASAIVGALFAVIGAALLAIIKGSRK
jgi:hypothetical protein